MKVVFLAAAVCLSSQLNAQVAPAAPAPILQPMGFFITSIGLGDGANLGGVAGADAHCQNLAKAAGAGARTWHAYLSSTGAAPQGQAPVNARDRIGSGPWYNAKGALIAWNVAELHGDFHRDRNSINKEFALNEKGLPVNGRGDTPNQHDIITGSDSFGRAMLGTAASTTCNNYTSNVATGSTMLGHHDRSGGGNSSWNSAHPSRGCGQAELVATGGAGLFYCFAL
ncbi:MAG TPA: hypothetical protein VM053_12140 [Gemmatimonadaceae bacterium]|nr:hypothetical protein [Gemmatimonadaceae bacterium]